jgi:hypothetical protein
MVGTVGIAASKSRFLLLREELEAVIVHFYEALRRSKRLMQVIEPAWDVKMWCTFYDEKKKYNGFFLLLGCLDQRVIS